MLLNRRVVLRGALSLVPMTMAADDELLALGAQLEVLRRRAIVHRRSGLDGAGWQRWHEALVEAVALAERIGRTPAHDVAGFAIKLRALACEWDDDLEVHQLQRLHALAVEMEQTG